MPNEALQCFVAFVDQNCSRECYSDSLIPGQISVLKHHMHEIKRIAHLSEPIANVDELRMDGGQKTDCQESGYRSHRCGDR